MNECGGVFHKIYLKRKVAHSDMIIAICSSIADQTLEKSHVTGGSMDLSLLKTLTGLSDIAVKFLAENLFDHKLSNNFFSSYDTGEPLNQVIISAQISAASLHLPENSFCQQKSRALLVVSKETRQL